MHEGFVLPSASCSILFDEILDCFCCCLPFTSWHSCTVLLNELSFPRHVRLKSLQIPYAGFLSRRLSTGLIIIEINSKRKEVFKITNLEIEIDDQCIGTRILRRIENQAFRQISFFCCCSLHISVGINNEIILDCKCFLLHLRYTIRHIFYFDTTSFQWQSCPFFKCSHQQNPLRWCQV